MSRGGKAKWLQSKTREELKNTLGWGDPPNVRNCSVLSAHHPLIPRRYVPAWQTDMENRKLIIQVTAVLFSSKIPVYISTDFLLCSKVGQTSSC